MPFRVRVVQRVFNENPPLGLTQRNIPEYNELGALSLGSYLPDRSSSVINEAEVIWGSRALHPAAVIP
jgi:hypothetical protein